MTSSAPDAPHDGAAVPKAKAKPDRSGRKRTGRASFYADKFSGRKRADGTIMHPQANNAASKTLPLETTARVTDLETGRSAVVVIRDRGPYVGDRIIDLSPATAREIGLKRAIGVVEVTVVPITIPRPDAAVGHGQQDR